MKYVDKSGQEVGLKPTFHVQKASADFVPPPS